MPRLALATTLTLALTAQANALSCMMPTVRDSYAAAASSADIYVIGLGRLTPYPGQVIPADPADPNDRKGYSLRMRFEGDLATQAGFQKPRSFDVTLEVTCAGPWCGGIPGGEQILFLRQHGDSYVAESGPCPWFILPPTPENRSDVITCLNGRHCDTPR